MNGEELTGDTVAATFDAAPSLTVGIEEELMLLDPDSGDLVPRSRDVLDLLDGDARFKVELPAAQLEIVTPPRTSVGEAIGDLRRGRADLATATRGVVRLAGAGVHPFAAAEGELNRGPRYDHTAREYGTIARRQLVFALQVHVAPGGANRGLAVYNALRSYLPELAALAANAPFHAGADTGLASVRPKIAEALPRQGVPPAIASWDAYAEALRWGRASTGLPGASAWWWELRPHPAFGTLELRVPDTQTTTREAAGVAAVAHCLVARLGDRFDAGEELAVAPAWRIEENRWRAARDGVEGELADLATGRLRPARERLGELLDELADAAGRLGCASELTAARELVAENGAIRQRRAAAEAGIEALGGWLADRWLH
jgi:carboxylate-amine ligase